MLGPEEGEREHAGHQKQEDLVIQIVNLDAGGYADIGDDDEYGRFDFASHGVSFNPTGQGTFDQRGIARFLEFAKADIIGREGGKSRMLYGFKTYETRGPFY